MLYLYIHHSGQDIKSIKLNNGDYVIGRSNVEIPIDDLSISRRHAKISVESGIVRISDLGSSNGTYVNGKKIQESLIYEGDRIKIGKIYLSLEPDPSNIESDKTRLITLQDREDNYERDKGSSWDIKTSEDFQEKTVLLRLDNLRLVALYQVCSIIHSVLEPEHLLNCLAGSILEVTDADRLLLFLLDSNEVKNLKPKIIRCNSNSFLQKNIDENIISSVLKKKASILHSNDNYSAICTPLKSREKVLGVLLIEVFSEYKSFLKEDLNLLETIGNQAGLALERAKLHDDLAHSVIELKKARDELIKKEKLAAIGQMVTVIAHELRTPLSAISSSIYYIKKKMTGGDEKLERHTEIISECIREVDSIIRELLDFTRQPPLKKQTTNISVLIEEALQLCQGEIKNIDIIKEIRKDLPLVYLEPDKIRRVFINLINNASQAMEGKGKLNIRISYNDSFQKVEINIIDSGIGISPQDIQHIFEPFFTTRKGGVGLGLAIVKGIIDRHQGTINVESIPGQTKFTITLPIHE